MMKFKFIDFKRYLEEIECETLASDVLASTTFSSLGLDSMDMIEVFFRIEQDYHISIPLNIIGENDTIQQFIDKLNSLNNGAENEA